MRYPKGEKLLGVKLKLCRECEKLRQIQLSYRLSYRLSYICRIVVVYPLYGSVDIESKNLQDTEGVLFGWRLLAKLVENPLGVPPARCRSRTGAASTELHVWCQNSSVMTPNEFQNLNSDALSRHRTPAAPISMLKHGRAKR